MEITRTAFGTYVEISQAGERVYQGGLEEFLRYPPTGLFEEKTLYLMVSWARNAELDKPQGEEWKSADDFG